VREMYSIISRLRKAGGRVELVEAKGENQVFYILYPNSSNTNMLIQDVAMFLNAQC